MMTNRRTPHILKSKPSRYQYAVLVGATGVILLVLGFIIAGWVWLVWGGFALILAAVYFVSSGSWPTLPTYLARQEPDDNQSSPPSPTA